MYKDELIQLHQLFVYLSKFFMDNGAPKNFFDEYSSIGVNPHHIHRTKAEHKYAIFMLAWSISNVLAENNEIVPRRVANRIKTLANRCKKEML